MPSFFKPALFVLLLFSTVSSYSQQGFSKGSKASWVETVEYAEDPQISRSEISSGTLFLLISTQNNRVKKERFVQLVQKLVNEEGVSQNSTITLEYDPAYQTLRLNSLRIKRDGAWIDKLSSTHVEIIQREAQLERHIYDGSVTAFINLNDVRKGDILEYSYTIKGESSFFEGRFSSQSNLQYSIPVGKLMHMYLIPDGREIYTKLHNTEMEATETTSGGVRKLVWEKENVAALSEEVNTPGWYSPYPSAEVSDYDSWESVAEWAVKVFKVTDSEQKKIGKMVEEVAAEGNNPEQKMDLLLNFVQDEIRYMGYEDGIGGYKPRAPSSVYKNRFGDCKDKSLLLSLMLNHIGIEAWPTLVHTYEGKALPEKLPGVNKFNHCVVLISHKGNEFVVDPTWSRQGGNILSCYTPNYYNGLVIRGGEAGLQELKRKGDGFKKLETYINLGEFGEPVTFKIETRFHGVDADIARSELSLAGINEVEENYLEFYRSIYGEVESLGEFSITDFDSAGINKIVTKEAYTISDFWDQDAQNPEKYTGEVFPIELIELIENHGSSGRTMPYALNYPTRYEHDFFLETDGDWGFEDFYYENEKPGYKFEMVGTFRPGVNNIYYEYEINKPFLTAAESGEYFKGQDELLEEMSFMIWSETPTETPASADLIFLLLVIPLSIFAMYKLNAAYDPPPRFPESASQDFGGWLYLPGIGLVLTFLIAVRDVFIGGEGWSLDVILPYFDSTLTVYSPGAGLWMLFDYTTDIFFIALVGLLLYQMYSTRSSLPKLYILMIGLNLLLPILQIPIAFLFPDIFLPEGPKQISLYTTDLFRPIIFAAIWIPIFLTSEKVGRTFTNRFID